MRRPEPNLTFDGDGRHASRSVRIYLTRLQIAALKIKPLNRKARQVREDKIFSFALFARLAVRKKRKTCPRSV
jgi:hypothetical protein